MLVEPGLERAAAILGLAVAGEGDQEDVARLGIRARGGRERIPIQPGEPDVHQCDVWTPVAELLQSVEPFGRRDNLVP